MLQSVHASKYEVLETVLHRRRPLTDVVEHRAVSTKDRSIADTTNEQPTIVDSVGELACNGNTKVVSANAHICMWSVNLAQHAYSQQEL